MNALKGYKLYSYIILILVVIVSFAITSIMFTLIFSQKIAVTNIIFPICNLLLTFAMFYIIYKFSQIIDDKNNQITDLNNQLSIFNIKEENIQQETEEKYINIDELADKVVPQNVQNISIEEFSSKVLTNIATICELVQAVFYSKNKDTNQFQSVATYAYYSNIPPVAFLEGETITGQVAKNKKILNLDVVPDGYISVTSGLGNGNAKYMLIFPILYKDETIGVIELASFKQFDKTLEQVFEKLSIVLGKLVIKTK